MTDTIIENYRLSAPTTKQRIYTANIIESVVKRIGKDQYAITDIIICTTSGTKHRFSVSLKVGTCLYLYINSNHRSSRMSDILFKFTVDIDSQKVMSSLAYDAAEWIGDALERNGKIPKSSQY